MPRLTARQRFASAMTFGVRGQIPLFEEGLRDEVIARWQGEGLSDQSALLAMFRYDVRERLELDLSPSRPGDIEARLPADWGERVARWRDREHVLEWPLHAGLFLTMGVGDYPSLEQALLRLSDEPARIRDAMEAQAQTIIDVAGRVLRDVQIDFASFSEPIASTHGPLISPAMYRELALTSYRSIIAALRGLGVRHFVMVSYANVRPLLEDMVAAGFDGLWAVERDCDAMDYLDLRRRFGRDLSLIGGIDLDALARGPSAIEHEIMRQVPSLLEQGGYIPLADGRVRADVSFADYCAYRTALERAATGPGVTRAPRATNLDGA